MLRVFNFTDAYRLKKADDFSSVFKFKRIKKGFFLKMYFKPNFLSHSRIGFIISKKINKFANKRNYMKRLLRELFRNNQTNWSGHDIIIRVEKCFTRDDFIKIVQEFEFLTKQFSKL